MSRSLIQIVALQQEQAILNALPKGSGNTPIGKLMNADQAERFGHLRTQILAFNFDEMIESGLARDSEAVSVMYSAAKAQQENAGPPKSSNKAPLLLYSVLHSDPAMKPNCLT
ncbi:hypothetical protein HLH33_18545 [Gluconacetobacter diazotrophicus]|uniref:Uncharacterized protein n=1 Tax=Gluconacetobacter diazotrophicus TaxID=33996 RepID=A0A7W4I8K3_GLUDI|nr:hypothetical protein [Gluconacetobacter diazotrophicus]MBB2158267.1 hypothetical protein [Gluconacetobacter diazotrophicus]